MPSLKKFLGGAARQLQRRLLLNVPLQKVLNKKKSVLKEDKNFMLNELWNKILDYCSPYDLLRLRRVNKRLKAIIDQRLKKILYLQVYRMDLSLVLGKDGKCNGSFYRHRNAQILLEILACNATIIVHDQWTARDIQYLFAGVRQLGANAHTITISASIAELLIAGQSTLDLEQWYSFQCYLKTLNNFIDESMVHVQGVQTTTNFILFPKLKELTIRMTMEEVNALVRLKDYCSNLGALYSLDNLQMFRLCLIGQNPHERCEELLQLKRQTKQQLKTFKQWLDSASLGERFCQQYL